MARKSSNDSAERLKIQEKALSNLADAIKKRDASVDEDLRDILTEIKALKVFLSRSIPEFRKQFPEIRNKIK